VLDVASGEGYGTALRATVARSAIGLDASEEAVKGARRRYGDAERVEFRHGTCEAIPLPDAGVDLVVSFETLEHIAAPENLVAEAARVLAAGGLFVVSTPNKEIYSDRAGYRNPFHLRELYRDEFLGMIGARFPHAAFFGQRVDTYGAIWPLSAAPGRAEVLEARKDVAADAVPGVPSEAMYFIAVCGRDAAAVAAAAGRFSLFADRDHGVSETATQLRRRFSDLVQHLNRLEAAYGASQDQVAAITQERDRLAARVRQMEAQVLPAWPKR
jgi:SAM-dependent methyltransferase